MKVGRPAPVPRKTASYPLAMSSSTVKICPMTMSHRISTPSFSRYSTSAWTMSLGRRNSGIPYTSTPPALCRASNTVTLCPFLIRSPARVNPAGPEPTTAIFFPVGGAMGGRMNSPCFCSISAANRSSRPMATGSPFFPRMHTFSHWSSWGQTRPQTAGRLFISFSLRAAPPKSP